MWDSEELTDELNVCQHFLTNTEMEKGRHKVNNFQLSKLDFNLDIEKLDQVFGKFAQRKSILPADLFCHDMPKGLYTRWDYNEETQKFKAREHQVRTFGNLVMSYFWAARPETKTESYCTTRT